MFCDKCGASIPEESRFCKKCGASLAVAPVSPSHAGPEPAERKKASGFFSSPAGIALIVVLALAVIAGVTVGVVFLAKGGGGSDVDEATVKVWDGYEALLEDNSEDIPRITVDQALLAGAAAELEKSLDDLADLEKELEKNAGTEQRRSGDSTRSTRDVKADQLAASLAAYKEYLKKLGELVAALAGANLLDANAVNNINRILSELADLGAEVKATTNKFLAGNRRVVTVKVDPPILKLAKVAAAEIQTGVTAAQNAELQRLEAERAAAEASAAAAAAEAEEDDEPDGGDISSRCPNCGAPYGDWFEVNTGWYCQRCGYRIITR